MAVMQPCASGRAFASSRKEMGIMEAGTGLNVFISIE
jgi:hypothetical protein